MKEDCPFTEEQVQWLKDNLRIYLETEWKSFDVVLSVKIRLNNEVITSDYIGLSRLKE